MDTSPLTPSELNLLDERLPGWSHVAVDGVARLQRVYSVPSLAKARTFTQLLAEMATTVNHHPAILTETSEITVAWWTMANNSITRADVTMAEKTDRLFDAIVTAAR
jgi:4a-hydroxytetrahydrobiopterin dehydratase